MGERARGAVPLLQAAAGLGADGVREWALRALDLVRRSSPGD